MSKSHIPEILLADDDREDCAFFKDALEEFQTPTKLTTVDDGEQLMTYLKKKKHLPNALFLDLNMPRKSGYQCLTEIKQDERLKKLLIIVISTSFDPSIVELVRMQGAQHYICKPVDYSQLLKVTHQAIAIITQPRDTEPFNKPTTADFVLSSGIMMQ